MKLLALVALAPAMVWAADAVQLELPLDAKTVQRRFDPQRISGTNLALWVGAETYQSSTVQGYLRDAGFSLFRIPGGSWSDTTFWNGNGVRDPKTGAVDRSKMKDGYPDIDYSGYAPTITVRDKPPHEIGDFHGNVDVKTLHEYIQKLGGQTLVCVNAGTGRPIDAAEWVRFANKTNNFNARYWEVGNELDGNWEAGHFLADGSRLTGEMYAKRFADFARAMKQVDPSIRVGGAASGVTPGGFAEIMLRDAGEHVDFVSIHSYPGNPLLSTEDQFKRVLAVRDDVTLVRQFISQHQSARKDQIEIGYTEWNLPATRIACELTNALWSSLFMREMVVQGVDFATQWDAFTQGPDEEGGHALIMTFTDPPSRKSQYWAMAMWNSFVGPQLLASGTIEGSTVDYMITRRGDERLTMLVNRSESAPASVRFTGITDVDWMLTARLSQQEYLWNPFTRRPQWNTGPRLNVVDAGTAIELPPLSLTYVMVPLTGAARPGFSTPFEPPLAQIKVFAPSSAFANEQVEMLIVGLDKTGELPAAGKLPDVQILAAGKPIGAMALDQGAARFRFRPETDGELQLTVRSGEIATQHALTVKKAEPRPVIVWDGEEKTYDRDTGYESDWKMTRDETIRANQPVVRVDVQGASTDGNPVLLRLSRLPEQSVNREGIRGVFFDLKSAGLTSADPQARIDVVLQSEADWWMHLGSIPLTELGDWKTYQFMMNQEKHIKAAPQMRNIWLVLRSSDAPSGTVYLDRIGFMIR